MIEVILFDLGGVLIENRGIPVFLEWTEGRLTVDEIWSRWLASPAVRLFESGGCTTEMFARGVLDEFSLPVTEECFIREFTSWPHGLFPGAVELLERLSRSFTLACLSNSNELHWNRVRDEMDLLHRFHVTLSSHQIGMLKPDREIFLHAIEVLGCAPERILFLDDNRLNVEAARSAGMVAHRVAGIEEIEAAIEEVERKSE